MLAIKQRFIFIFKRIRIMKIVLKKTIQVIKSKIIEIGLELFLKTIIRSSSSHVWWEFVPNLWCIARESCMFVLGLLVKPAVEDMRERFGTYSDKKLEM